MKDLSKVSRREFGKLAAAGLSLALPKGLLALDQRGQLARPGRRSALRRGTAPASRRECTLREETAREPAGCSLMIFARLWKPSIPRSVAIAGCSDSRVAPEILFDVGVGDIFVVRVAGNVVSGAGVTVKGSIEYAVAELNVPLIMVLGHSGCGAVKAAMKHIDAKDSLPGAINGLVELIKPAVTQSKGMPGDALENAIRKNVEVGVAQLKQLDPILAPRVKEGKLKIVGAVYDLRNGAVTLVEPGKS